MKKLSMLTNMAAAFATVCLVAGCSAVATNNAELAASQKEMMLTQSGFKSMNVTNAKQQQQLSKLAVDKVSAVKNQGKLYYVFPTAKKDQILIGKQAQFNTYKSMLQTQQAKIQQGTAVTGTQAQPENSGFYNVGETAGPNHVIVEDFDGFGPIQDNPAWQ